MLKMPSKRKTAQGIEETESGCKCLSANKTEANVVEAVIVVVVVVVSVIANVVVVVIFADVAVGHPSSTLTTGY